MNLQESKALLRHEVDAHRVMPLPSKKLIGFKGSIQQPGSFPFRPSPSPSSCHSAANQQCPSSCLEWSLTWGQDEGEGKSSPMCGVCYASPV